MQAGPGFRNEPAPPEVYRNMSLFKKIRVPLLIGLVLIGGWLLLRTPATPLASIEELDARLAAGKPVVLEFYANT